VIRLVLSDTAAELELTPEVFYDDVHFNRVGAAPAIEGRARYALQALEKATETHRTAR